MEPISTDRKLALLQKIRQEQQYNQTKLHDRASFLYGTPAGKGGEAMPPFSREGESADRNFLTGSSLKFRLILSILLVACVFACHYFNKSVFGYCAEDLDGIIAQEMINTEELYEQLSFKP